LIEAGFKKASPKRGNDHSRARTKSRQRRGVTEPKSAKKREGGDSASQPALHVEISRAVQGEKKRVDGTSETGKGNQGKNVEFAVQWGCKEKGRRGGARSGRAREREKTSTVAGVSLAMTKQAKRSYRQRMRRGVGEPPGCSKSKEQQGSSKSEVGQGRKTDRRKVKGGGIGRRHGGIGALKNRKAAQQRRTIRRQLRRAGGRGLIPTNWAGRKREEL